MVDSPEHQDTTVQEAIAAVVALALNEDLGGYPGLDVTSMSTIDSASLGTAEVVARADGVVAGLAVWPAVLGQVAERFSLPVPKIDLKASDGDHVKRGDVLATIVGCERLILIAERTGLNVMSRLSGVATHTAAWVDVLAGRAQVLDTRKTTPGMRTLEKYAVRCGGGVNKRFGLYDVAMIKDNHKIAAGSVTAAFEAVREKYPQVAIQVEVVCQAEALEAIAAGARFLLCDNMSAEILAQTVKAVRALPLGHEVELEATGGLTLQNADAYAGTGVNYLSVGALTHSSPILDIALDLQTGG